MNEYWTDISAKKAWALASASGKTPPYAGYMHQLSGGDLRCVRDDLGTRYQWKASPASQDAPRIVATPQEALALAVEALRTGRGGYVSLGA